MGKKLPHTPNSRIKSTLRQLFLRSRERASALKRDENRCQACGKKASVAKGRVVKVEVHHTEGIDWQEIYEIVRKQLLCNEKFMRTYCKECHKIEGE